MRELVGTDLGPGYFDTQFVNGGLEGERDNGNLRTRQYHDRRKNGQSNKAHLQ